MGARGRLGLGDRPANVFVAPVAFLHVRLRPRGRDELVKWENKEVSGSGLALEPEAGGGEAPVPLSVYLAHGGASVPVSV